MVEDKNKITASINILTQYQQILKQRKQDIENEIKKVKEEIENLYSKLKKHKYVLQSILIHTGMADLGHYYAYIHNNDGTWQKYNDIQITDEKEEQVFKEAIGGLNNVSAYCLVYRSQKSIDEETEQKNKFMKSNPNLVKELTIPKPHYTVFLKEALKNEVDKENKRFHDEVQEYRFQTFLKNIMETYQTRIDTLISISNSVGSQTMPYHINSFGTYLIHQKSERLLRWYVLDTCLQDTNPSARFKLRELKGQPRLLKSLQSSLESIGRRYAINSLVLSKEEELKLDVALSEYIEQIPGAILVLFILEKSMDEEWIEVLYGMKVLNQKVLSYQISILISKFC